MTGDDNSQKKAKPTKQVDPSKVEIEALTDQMKRAQADFVNYKNRVERDQGQFILMTYVDVLSNLLPVLDNLKRVVSHIPDDLAQNEWAKGVLATVSQFEDTMKQFGVTTIPSVGQKVNPELHEAIAAGEGEKDVIIVELETGYMFREKVLRPAKVKVGSG